MNKLFFIIFFLLHLNIFPNHIKVIKNCDDRVKVELFTIEFCFWYKSLDICLLHNLYDTYEVDNDVKDLIVRIYRNDIPEEDYTIDFEENYKIVVSRDKIEVVND